jgi:hypothetical protein
MSVEKVKITVNRCVCGLPGCIGKRKPWYSRDEQIPQRCNWCKRSTWNRSDRRYKEGQSQETSSVEKVTITVNRCVCELPDCCGNRKPWHSKDERIPARCKWCFSSVWNRPDRRRKDGHSQWARIRQCTVCGGIEWVTNDQGEQVCAHCSGATSAPASQPQPAVQPIRHASGCTCTICTIQRNSIAPIVLPKPRKIRERA